jgi:peptidoglycan hydrolase-like protein with peptidoglycan-binding domain
MTKTATDFASKLAVAFVAVAMVVAAFAPAAQAQSSEDLQQMINDLLAQVAQLQGTVTTGASMTCPSFLMDLAQGTSNGSVMELQEYLNMDPDTRVAAAGSVGSAGMETEFYGPATAAAVSKFQVKYRADILSPLGLVNPTGYWGAGSRAKANALCSETVVVEEEESEEEATEEEEEEEGDMTLSGSASLDTFEVDDGESTIEEGDEDVEIGEITVEFTNGDAEISRLDVTLNASGADAWDAFDTISLWVDGDKIAEVDASDEDDYLDEDASELRFSNLNLVAMEDEEMTIVVGASVQNNLDSDELNVEWTLEVSSMRFFDADGVATTEEDPAGSDVAQFDIEVAGADEELEISLASSNPDATDIIVDTDRDTDDVTIMIADLGASDNDIELDRIVVRVVTTGASTTDVVDEARLVIDGQSFSAESFGTDKGVIAADGKTQYVDNDATDDAVWYLFDIDGDVVIDEDDEVEMEVVIDFNDTDDGDKYGNGTTISASVISVEVAAWQAEGADDLDSTQFDGTAVGDTHVLVAEGIVVPADGFTSETDTLADGEIGEFTLEFEVTGVEGSFYITDLAATTTENNGVQYTVTGGGNAAITGTLTSSADEDSGVFEVREGETETFTLTVTVSGSSAVITPRVALTAVNYSESTDGLVNGGTGDIEGKYLPLPVSDFRTGVQTVQTASN